ncbi:histidine kinase [Bacillus altitudinis MN12]|uniref:ATP-binding protein n=2 Tax=Bacillus TaxID=1386 RepID=UPI000D6BA17F|nr:ATP-binding protein [Bacillus altitudinis]MBY0185803.1 histidine kinase [Bacillus aerophilus]MBR0583895.1 histidine kinase [Bacillus altitudinis MN12]MBR0594029.1 histidine kinase [Bacillus altitudinis C16B11]MBR0609031.1 histidine kinase [Bacillus altitudinis]MCW4359827.1 histidine kinase [Bacillus altitudinis]
MKLTYTKWSTIFVFLSFLFVIYISYIYVFDIFNGARVEKNGHGQTEVVNVEYLSLAYSSGLKEGDIILKINGQSNLIQDHMINGKLRNVQRIDIQRGNQIISLKNKTLIGRESLFVYLIPLLLYSICLFCIFFIIKINKEPQRKSAFLLILFLLSICVGYLSAGTSGIGDKFSHYVLFLCLSSVSILYIHFIYQYFKEFDVHITNLKLIKCLYLIPIFNLLVHSGVSVSSEWRKFVPSISLLFFFGTVLTALFLIVRGMKRYKETEHGSVLKFFAIMNILSFCPFIFFFVIPYVFFDKYLIDPFILTSVVLLIPFSLVYQFVTNKIYNMNFLISRLRYYGFLAITPTIFVVVIFYILQKPEDLKYTLKLAIITYTLMLGVFYFKEIIDFRFRLKRFSEKHNYQDSVFKFTQLIREASSLHQVLFHLKYTILEVLVVNKAFVLEVKADGQIEEIDESTDDSSLWKEYVDQFQDILGEVGKIIELDKGFMMKIGERGGHSFVICCLSNLRTPKLTRDEISWLKTLAFYTSVSLENVVKIEELMEHLEDLKQREANPAWLKKVMFAMEEKQRSDLARDLHDSVLQDLISLKRQSEMFLTNFQNNQCPTSIENSLISWNEQMSKVIQTTRETCHELRPQLLYDLGLVKAISKLTSQIQEEAPFHIRLNTTRFDKELDIDIDSQLNIYRIVQELLSNALKHSKASQVLVMLICIKDQVVLHYEDDGVGFDASQLDQHTMSMGLSGIRERVKALNGKLQIHTAPEKGLKVKIEMEL